MFPIDAVGHVNPLLAITRALTGRADVAEVRSFGAPELAGAFGEAGAVHVGIPNGPEPQPAPPVPTDLVVRGFLRPLSTIEEVLGRCAEFAADVVLYDVFSVRGFLAGRALDLPAVSLAVLPGYGALGEEFVRRHGESHPAVRQANRTYLEVSCVDVLAAGLPVLFPSARRSVVTAIEAMAKPVDPDRMPRLHALLAEHLPVCHYVGPCWGGSGYLPAPRAGAVGSRPVAHDRGQPFPDELLDQARRDGVRIVLFSLGTTLTDFRFGSPVGGAPTGRAYLLALLDRLIAAFGGDPGVLVVAALGSRLAEADEPDWPDNFVVRDVLPQVRLLDGYADVFITHNGLSSTVEAILAGVPMVAVPGAGDQLTNAELAREHGAAVAPWDLRDPFHGATAVRLAGAVRAAVESPGPRLACAALKAAIDKSGGAPKAAELVVELAG